MNKHKVFNKIKHKFTYHFPNWDFSCHTWDTDGKRKIWCKSNYCHESLIIGTVRINKRGITP